MKKISTGERWESSLGEFVERKEGRGQLPLRVTLGYVKKIFKELDLAAYYVMQFPYATDLQ